MLARVLALGNLPSIRLKPDAEICSRSVGTAARINAYLGGDSWDSQLSSALTRSLSTARGVDINVAFLMETGLELLLDGLRAAADRGAVIRILTGDYLGITSPSALYRLKLELGDAADLRMIHAADRSYHPKAYMFYHDAPDENELYIGSSNLSRSALTDGFEWNYRLERRQDPEGFDAFRAEFEKLFEQHALKLSDDALRRYASSWHRPAVLRDLQKWNPEQGQGTSIVPFVQPRGVQIEALYALQRSREEGADKALVQVATGVGKTYLAAFDSKDYSRVLVVAHRAEILEQAARTFSTVRPDSRIGFFDGTRKEIAADILCASVATLGADRYLKPDYFAHDHFDYVVIDEFHHAVSGQYRRILDYFKPRFLLGLTATPERLDGRDVYALCDYNVPYELSMQQAINRGALVPFHYYGIYDETDYLAVRRRGGFYDSRALTEAYEENRKRDELIFQNYQAHGSRQALGFCCSVQHAAHMAAAFRERGVRAAAVCSQPAGEYSEDRNAAVQKLRRGELDVIFSVDMFNEGVDLPSLDMVMFLRPTESPTIFMQQLGRGLRTYRGKEYVTVLDFIGNYAWADRIPSLLSSDKTAGQSGSSQPSGRAHTYPDGCTVHFDLRTIQLFERLERAQQSVASRIRSSYLEIKERLGGRVPTRLELFNELDDEVYRFCLARPKLSPFRGYLEFLHEMDDLSEEEHRLYNSVAREFIREVETTSMTRVYKLPVLEAFVEGGQISPQLSSDALLRSWKSFFGNGANWRDLGTESREDFLKLSDSWHLQKIRSMPVHYLLKSGHGFFVTAEDAEIALSPDLIPWLADAALQKHLRDVLDYRRTDYFQRRYQERTAAVREPERASDEREET
ncbi:MAG: DEAD/DEAH box helicase family protein [Clostridia bacterium]|nr:DEAD/DEAH box helicase family protein [Clostridia bacterium]